MAIETLNIYADLYDLLI